MIIFDAIVAIVTGMLLLLLLSRMIGRVQFSLSTAFWCSFIGEIFGIICSAVTGFLFAYHLAIAIILTVALVWVFMTVLFQIAVRAKKETLKPWRAAILSAVVILGYFVVAPPLAGWLCSFNQCQQTNVAQTEFQKFKKRAEQGAIDAQYMLGVCYYKGKGVEQDHMECVKWFRKAAEQGDNDAQYMLGRCYNEGAGVEKNPTEGVTWWRKAAEQGNEDAQFNLAYCYRNGTGTDKNYSEALKWFRKAAEQGAVDAQYMLGVCYAYGEGVEQNFTESVKWFRKAADQGYANAQAVLGSCYYNGKGVEKNFAEAANWYRKAAEQGYANAQDDLGICYANGDGVGKDFVEAYAWYDLASKTKKVSAEARDQIEKKMTPPQVLEAQKRSTELGKKIEIRLLAKDSGS